MSQKRLSHHTIKHFGKSRQYRGFDCRIFISILFYPALIILFLMGWNAPVLAGIGDPRPLDPAKQSLFFDRLKGVQENIRTFQADFIEKRKVSSLKTPLLFEGRIYYDAKGLFFMEYEKPFHYILRVRGKEALFYVDGNKTADIMDISGVQGMAGQVNLFAWKPEQFKGQVWQDDRGYRLETPEINETNAPRHLKILLDHNTLLLKQIFIKDGSGDLTEITVKNVQVNKDLPPSIIDYKLPEGIKLNRLSQP